MLHLHKHNDHSVIQQQYQLTTVYVVYLPVLRKAQKDVLAQTRCGVLLSLHAFSLANLEQVWRPAMETSAACAHA